jgi:hypothetical protein
LGGYVLTTAEKRLYISTPVGLAIINIDVHRKVWISGDCSTFQDFMRSPMSGAFWSSDGRMRSDDALQKFGDMHPDGPTFAGILGI